MNPSPVPKTPVRTPQTGSSAKNLQLTPIWESVVISHRIPLDVNENAIFQEISSRLDDLEWPVRQHAFRVLYDLIPIVSKDRLDERILQNDILNKLVTNLGHPAPGVRKVAMETIRQYMEQTRYSEEMLESFLMYGVREEDERDLEEAGIARENIILGTIMSLVDILKPFIFLDNGGYALSQTLLNKIVAVLSQKMKSPLYQEKCAETLWKIREMVGETRFLRTLDHLPDSALFDLIHLKELREKTISDASAVEPKPNAYQKETEKSATYSENHDSDQSFEMELENSVTTYHNYKMIGIENSPCTADWSPNRNVNGYKTADYSTEEYSDGTDTDTYTKETVKDDTDEYLNMIPEQTSGTSFTSVKSDVRHVQMESKERSKPPDIVIEKGRDDETMETLKSSDDNTSDSMPSSPRVVLETEIQFSEDKAIKMTIVEDEKDSAVNDNEIDLFPLETKSSRDSSAERRFVTEDGDLIMKILHDNGTEEFQEEERKRTPRRVRFGGEVIKLRTPDSDATDVGTENREEDGDGKPRPKQESTTRPMTSHGKPETKQRPEIKSVPGKSDPPKVDKLVVHSGDTPQSHIPLPISPATKSPRYQRTRYTSPGRKTTRERSKSPSTSETEKEVAFQGSVESAKDRKSDDESTYWKWTELGLITDKALSDLRNQNDWKIQYQALEDLKLTLINPRVADRLGKAANDGNLNSLFKCLLHKLPQSNSPQVTTESISVVFQLIQTLPKETIKRNLEDVVTGLCKYINGSKNINLKIESVQSLKMLFSILEPYSVIDILLEHCLTSSSSKIRENSLLAIMYATMIFPSNLFNTEKLLDRVAKATADSRRKVRLAALEAMSILSQFCSSEKLTDSVSKVADTLPNSITKMGLISAVQARLARRVLPTVSNEGLVLYSLQIPASRRFGSGGNPSGADVDWILSGTGSVSTGSAKSKGQLNAAQRLDFSTPLSPTRWRANNQSLAYQTKLSNSESNITEKTSKRTESENPWTIQKNRTELSSSRHSTQENWKNHGNRFYRAPSTGQLPPRMGENLRMSSTSNVFSDKAFVPRIYDTESSGTDSNGNHQPDDVSWALVPVSSLEEQQLAKIRGNQLWGEFGIENGTQYISSPLGTLRPLYLKFQPSPEHLSRSTDDLRRSSFSYGSHRGSERFSNDDFNQIRVLTPSILREKNRIDDFSSEPRASTPRILRSESPENEGPNRIPPLQSTTALRNNQKASKTMENQGNERRLADESLTKQNGAIIQNGGLDALPTSGAFFPSIHGHCNGNQSESYGYLAPHKGSLGQYSEIDESKIQETMTQLNGLLATSKSYEKPSSLANRGADAQSFVPGKKQLIENETILPIRNGITKKNSESALSNGLINGQNKLFDGKGNQALQNTVASAPPLINTNSRNQTPSTSSSNSTDFGGVSGSGIRIQRLKNGSGALVNSNQPYRNVNNCYNQKLKSNRISPPKISKSANSGVPFPDNLKPFPRPKEALETCFSQLDSQQWEFVMMGLTSLVRLLRHHPAIVLGHLHPVIMALGRQIRNLRSQVSRAACQAAGEMFSALRRNIETDLEELAGPLFHRSADTNRFIRLDCGHALDQMVDNVSPARSINAIISKGSAHQNAIVRTVAARLLLRLSEKIGPDKIFTLPRDVRDKVVQTGANLLLEGKLETRAFAKDLFRVWSSHPNFSNLMLEAIPPNVMRHISKTLISLKT